MVLLTFTAPTRPLSENESRRLHWAARKRRLDDWKTLTAVAWRKADPEDKKTLEGSKIVVKVSLPFSRKARRDAHNYIGTNIKAIIDSLISEGMAKDDTDEFIEVLEPSLIVDKTDQVVILLTPKKERECQN